MLLLEDLEESLLGGLLVFFKEHRVIEGLDSVHESSCRHAHASGPDVRLHLISNFRCGCVLSRSPYPNGSLDQLTEEGPSHRWPGVGQHVGNSAVSVDPG